VSGDDSQTSSIVKAIVASDSAESSKKKNIAACNQLWARSWGLCCIVGGRDLEMWRRPSGSGYDLWNRSPLRGTAIPSDRVLLQ
jgi:hypothetical protein